MDYLRGTGERAGLTTGPAGSWVYEHRTPLRVASVALIALIFVLWANPTWLAVLVLALVLLLILGLIELVGRPVSEDQPQS